MNDLMNPINFILFDYGATLDTGGTHWYHIFARHHLHYHPKLEDKLLRDAYVYAERQISSHKAILPEMTFLSTLRCKVRLQCKYLVDHGAYPAGEGHSEKIAQACYETARSHTAQAAVTLSLLKKKGISMGLVSNFYGNLDAVLKDFKLRSYFSVVIESAVVGIHKPSPALWKVALLRLRAPKKEVLVVGDSYPKDIVPAKSIGCHTAWLQGEGWGPNPSNTSEADYVISNLEELVNIVESLNKEHSDKE